MKRNQRYDGRAPYLQPKSVGSCQLEPSGPSCRANRHQLLGPALEARRAATALNQPLSAITERYELDDAAVLCPDRRSQGAWSMTEKLVYPFRLPPQHLI